MKSFDQWFRDASIGITEKEHEKETDKDIIDRCDPKVAEYNLCDYEMTIIDHCDADEFTADMAYCGRNEHCMP